MALRNILFIRPGPTMAVDDNMYDELSKYYSGAVVTSSRRPEIIKKSKSGTFDFYCHREPVSRPWLSTLRFFRRTILRCISWRIKGRHFDLVVTYDPLKTGILGAICALVFGSRFVPEINGVYTSPAVYMDDADLLSTKLRKWAYPKIEGWVLSRAHGARMLFPTQCAPFQRQLDGKPVAAFHCQVNIQPFLRCGDSQARNQVLVAGFPFYLKGVDILIRAFKLVADEFPDWHLKILGWYPDRSMLLKEIDNHPRIFHHPPVYPHEMPAQMQECSVFVLPSRSEAMGRVLVEAMAAGKPSIGANVDGIPTVINDGVDGLLFAPEDAADLSQKLRLLLSDPPLRDRMGRAGRERVRIEFSDEAFFRNLRLFYESVLSV